MNPKILAIDPGPVESAYIVWDGARPGAFGKILNAALLAKLPEFARSCERCVVEMISSFGMPVGAEVFETCVFIGRFMEAFGVERCDRITRIAIKNALCHSSRAKDGNVRQALIDRLGPPGTKRAPGVTYGMSGDVWSALAVAVTWSDQHI